VITTRQEEENYSKFPVPPAGSHDRGTKGGRGWPRGSLVARRRSSASRQRERSGEGSQSRHADALVVLRGMSSNDADEGEQQVFASP
jgi:hypothetical protein